MDADNNQNYQVTARLLLDTFRVFEDDLALQLSKKGFSNITPGNFNIIRHINPEGIGLTALAEDAQISKQAIGKMISDLERKGYVRVIPNITDGRAKTVQFTPKGEKLIRLAIDVVGSMENHYQQILGKKNYNIFRQSAKKIQDWHISNRE